MRTRAEKEHTKLIEQIREIMHPDHRRYLTVFRIDSELNLKQTIFHAIFKGKTNSQFFIRSSIFPFLLAHFAQTNLYNTNSKVDLLERSNENSQKNSLLELAIKWNCFDQATALLTELQYTGVSTVFSLAKIYQFYFRYENFYQNYSNKLLMKIVHLLLTIFFELTTIHVVHGF
jgi:hypothetical protein